MSTHFTLEELPRFSFYEQQQDLFSKALIVGVQTICDRTGLRQPGLLLGVVPLSVRRTNARKPAKVGLALSGVQHAAPARAAVTHARAQARCSLISLNLDV